MRGFSNPALMLIDEASRVTDAMYEALRPMLATGNGDLWLMSTPFGKRGFFWEDVGAGGPDLWTRMSVPATECPRISEEFLAEERGKGTRISGRSIGDTPAQKPIRCSNDIRCCEFVQADDRCSGRRMSWPAFGMMCRLWFWMGFDGWGLLADPKAPSGRCRAGRSRVVPVCASTVHNPTGTPGEFDPDAS